MIFLRSALFNLLFFSWTIVLVFGGLPVLVLPRRCLIFLQRFWARGMTGLLEHVVGITAEIRGREHVPPGASIVASKHQSAWETMIYVLLLRDPSFVLKREILFLPIFGLYVWKADLVPIDRKSGMKALRRMLRSAQQAKEEKRPIVIFPEGTRVAPGSHHPYHSGIVALYHQLRLPVVPVALNSGLFWGRRRFLKRPGKIVLEFLPPIPAGMKKAAFLAELEQKIEGATDKLLGETEKAE